MTAPSLLAAPDPAQGVFETMLVVEGAPVELDAHLARLEGSLVSLYGEAPPARGREAIAAAAAPLALGRVRITVAPCEDGLTFAVTAAAVDAADVFPTWERAVTLAPVVVPAGLGAHKWADRSALTAFESDLARGALPLLVDGAGYVLEASRANVFAVVDGALVTPPLDSRILAGVARARVIEIARSQAIEVHDEPLSLERLSDSAGAFLTGSVRGVEPVAALGDSSLPEPEPARALAHELSRRWRAGVAAAASR